MGTRWDPKEAVGCLIVYPGEYLPQGTCLGRHFSGGKHLPPEEGMKEVIRAPWDPGGIRVRLRAA
ncbi:unnamed protein product [Staurois parvus]|uniref:Uncharacterized protein n=1 Tax=Staurois parvus TaxID=386267 RepID=A0ABN9HMB7_9NEOB|nr:unnamed protein product [Staurois parvus]